MIIKIKSNNKYLLDILHKNPNTDEGLYFKELKNGIIVGNAVSEHQYDCVFQDTKYSYLPEDSNQIDFQSYCSPLIVLNLLTEFFSHLLKETKELEQSTISWLDKKYIEIDSEETTIEIPTIYVDSGWIRDGKFLLGKYISGIELTHKVGNNYSLKLNGKNIIEAINKLSLTALFIQITNRYAIYTYITDDFAEKYIRILTNIKDVPYFVFYLFIKRVMRSPQQFESYKPMLEKYFEGSVQFVFTDTHNSRKEFICSKIDFNQPVLDFGCGELQYFKKLRGRGFKQNYIAFDEYDYEFLVNKMREEDKSTNLFWKSKLEDLVGFEGQVILSEVIEHNTLEDAKNIMTWIRDNTKFTQLYITTPNSDFNQYYEMTEDFRHNDHHFELTKLEFKDLINSIFTQEKTYHGIGDCVHGIYPTSAAIINH
jgi:hypothetical protein